MNQHASFPDSAETIAQWSLRPLACDSRANALTVDVEDYFQVEAFAGLIDRKDWPSYEGRVERNVDRILAMFERAGVTATFFTLGWIAKRHPILIRKIVDAGHELASHGTMHLRAAAQAREDFREDIVSAKALLEDLSGVEVKGYRAPSFSITRDSLWIFEELNRAGYRYSSSTYPIHHDLYGIPEAPRFAFRPFEESDFLEIPVTSVRLFNTNLPCGGGGYFRLLPYWWTSLGLNRVRENDKQPCMFYFHPWEIDSDQPRIPGTSLKTRVRHYTNLGRMEKRLVKLLDAFEWQRIDRVYPIPQAEG
ncbi:MAG TPA: XrtA system polysaccharide deacetylase [Rhizomicrobium sp.]|nr:XrtA system polysaccharide deacetylase [Rhizomicrobium sp.]